MSRAYLLTGIEKIVRFRSAARTGKLDLLKEFADVKDSCNRGALHFAAGDGLTDVCKYLLEVLKLDVNVKDKYDTSPLTLAAEEGHTATAKYLVEYGAAIQTDNGKTALHGAAVNGSRTPLVWAASGGHQDAVKLLLEHGADPNGHPEDNDLTPLHGAISSNSVPCLELLIKANADVHFAAGGANSLHVAAYHGFPEIIKCLLQAGANPNGTSDLRFPYTDDEWRSKKPIEVAAAGGFKEAVEILFPVTTPIDIFQEWSVDGILEHMPLGRNKVVLA